MKDIIIIGAGPAGMTAALYAARAGMDVMLLESTVPGGQIKDAAEVENYPAMPSVAGWQLAQNMIDQLSGAGVSITNEAVTGIRLHDGRKTVVTEGGEYDAKAVIIASGVKRRKLGCEGEEKLASKGVSYCAVCDGAFFRKKTVAVVGGGNSALEDALYLAGICEKVYLIHRRDEFRGEHGLADRVANCTNVEILYSCEVVSINGDDRVESATVKSRTDGGIKEVPLSAVFIAVGLVPDNDKFGNILTLKDGYILAGEDCVTNVPGIFAAGDTRTKRYRQVITAASDGATAATAAAEYIRQEG